MPYLALCRDDPRKDCAGLRAREKARHFAYIESILEHLLVAGPLSCSPGADFDGSLFLYMVETEAQARRLLENDPYYRAGIYADVQFRYFVPAAGAWTGGTVW